MMHDRPLTISMGQENIVLERECPACEGTGRWLPDLEDSTLACDFCVGGYIPSFEGEAILQLVSVHLKKVLPNAEILHVLTERLSIRP